MTIFGYWQGSVFGAVVAFWKVLRSMFYKRGDRCVSKTQTVFQKLKLRSHWHWFEASWPSLASYASSSSAYFLPSSPPPQSPISELRMDQTFLPTPSLLKSSFFLFSKSTGLFAANCTSDTPRLRDCILFSCNTSPWVSTLVVFGRVFQSATVWQMISGEKVAVVLPTLWFPFPTICIACSPLQ